MKEFPLNMNVTDIAVIGLSCRFPGSKNADLFWKNLVDGKELIQRMDRDKLDSFGVSKDLSDHPNYINACAFLEDIDKFDHDFFKISAIEAAAMDPQQRLFLENAHHALEDSGYTPDKFKGKIGIYAGSGPTQYYYELIRNNYFNQHPQSRQLLHYLGNEKDFLALRVAYALNLTGPAININLASATGLAVVVKACQSLANGEADIMLAGASSIILPSQFGYIYEPENIFSQDGHCRPFDKNSTGTVLGSGIGVVVLKRLKDAIDDNDSIYAVIKGYSINNDGNNKIGFTAPSISGQAACFQKALEMSGIDPLHLKYVEAHGTGTHLGDPIEVAALTKGLRTWTDHQQFCAIGSVKGNIGHSQSASGIAGIIKLILSIKHGLIPPSLNFESPNPKINFNKTPFYVNSKRIKWDDAVRVGGVNSLAMGGVNVHIIAENYNEPSSKRKNENEHNIVPLSANTESALNEIKSDLISYLKSLTEDHINDADLFNSLAYTLQTGRKDFPIKSAYLCQNLSDLLKELSKNAGDPIKNHSDISNLIGLRNAWLSGEKVNWGELYFNKPRKISLPNYPFTKTSHWLLGESATSLPSNNNEKNQDVQSIIEKMTEIWKNSLQLNTLGYEDNFESLGGDSLLAIAIIAEIEKYFNIRISIEDFLKHNSVIKLANYIAQQNHSDISKAKLQFLTKPTEDAPSLFIIHPGNGELYFYQDLSDLLMNKLNVIGIHNNVFNDMLENDPVAVPSLAKCYIDLIKKHQPQGPYILCGWSFGGVVAFEMARQLEAQNELVGHLFLIDSWARYSNKFNDSDYFFNSYLTGNSDDALLLSNTGLWGKLLWKRMEALFNYKPTLIDAKVTLLKATSINEEYRDVNAFDNHWQKHCKNVLSTILIPGNHETILKLPGLNELTNAILNAFKKSKSTLEIKT